MAEPIRYFKMPAIYHWMWITAGMGLLTVVTLAPDVIPYDSLGPLGSLLRFFGYDHPLLTKAIFVGAYVAHVLEGVYGWILSRRLNLVTSDVIKWTVQTVYVGFPSLLLLRAKLRKVECQKKN